MDLTKKILLLNLFQGLVCQRWEFPTEIVGLVGSCVEIPCTFQPRENSRTSSTVWYLYQSTGYTQIFNSQRSTSASTDYRGRTSLVPGRNDCSLKIDPVRRDDGEESYYPGIAEDQETNAWTQQDGKILRLRVTDTPQTPILSGNSNMEDRRPAIVSCSVVHTCGSNPPSLKWNKPGQTERRSEDLSGGNWREILRITYIASHEDDKTEIQCTATHHNGRTSQGATTLNIRYAPKDVTVGLPNSRGFVEGSSVTLTCSSRSNPPPYRYEWYLGNPKIGLGLQDQRIKVLNVTTDTEPYSCVAINDLGRGESPPTQIPVQYAPKNVMVGLPKKEEFLEGSDVILTCSSRSNPPPLRYEWYRGNKKMELESKEQKIKVQNVNKDTEPYSCTAINIIGKGESPPTEIPVQYAAAGVHVAVHHPTEGATELKCTFISSHPNVTHYTWMKDGNILLNTTEQILVLDSNEDNSGSYSCIAHNRAGNSTSAELDFGGNKAYLFLILGILAGVILLTVIVYYFTRAKACHTSSKDENSHQPNATYMDLVKREISSAYDTLNVMK